MGILRRRSNDDNNPADKTPAVNPQARKDDGWDTGKMRDLVFTALANRVGEEGTQQLREDFIGHLVDDPINGAERGWICLVGKLIETIDRYTEALELLDPVMSAHPASTAGPRHGAGYDGPVSPFTTFRKDG